MQGKAKERLGAGVVVAYASCSVVGAPPTLRRGGWAGVELVGLVMHVSCMCMCSYPVALNTLSRHRGDPFNSNANTNTIDTTQQRLSEEAYRHWGQIVERRLDFHREHRWVSERARFPLRPSFCSCMPSLIVRTHCPCVYARIHNTHPQPPLAPGPGLIRLLFSQPPPTTPHPTTNSEVAALKTLTKADALSLWDAKIAASCGDARRKLAVYVYSRSHQGSKLPVTTAERLGQSCSRQVVVESMEALRTLKRGLPLYPAPGAVVKEEALLDLSLAAVAVAAAS